MNGKVRLKSVNLTAKITKHIQDLTEATDRARLSEAMTSFLDSCSRFHQYSYCNVLIIKMTKPDATHVAGYKQWPKFNRCVRKGEKGIAILAPLMFRVDPDDPDNKSTELGGFKVVYVFDVSQTDGEPLPEPPEWKSPEMNTELNRKLTGFAISHNIVVIEKEQPGEVQGRSLKGTVEIDPSAGTKTLVHEIAHELLHNADAPKLHVNIRELEAESVAYVVCKHFGLDGFSSPNYVALHGATSELILSHHDRIRTTAARIIKSIDD
ncbi:ArdC family protein [Chloroflexota bacterium]